ncbi:MAG TPA: TetR/AcrR family transcriptional regulator [Thermoanaerobaculia bacterium]|nr:TetR/AcrR family transcriptional regulator [Thermoanaerobaculia bacterium]
MRRRPDPRKALLAAVADYLLGHGLANLSLRPLAAATGTSARMLVYHFSSKERLIAEAMNEIRTRQQKLAETWIRGHPAASFDEFLELVWSWVAAAQHEPYLRLFLEVLGRGIGDVEPFAEFSRSTFADWVSWIQRRFEKAGRPAEQAKAFAILTVSAIRGLALYSVATKNKRGARQALRAFIRLSRKRERG